MKSAKKSENCEATIPQKRLEKSESKTDIFPKEHMWYTQLKELFQKEGSTAWWGTIQWKVGYTVRLSMTTRSMVCYEFSEFQKHWVWYDFSEFQKHCPVGVNRLLFLFMELLSWKICEPNRRHYASDHSAAFLAIGCLGDTHTNLKKSKNYIRKQLSVRFPFSVCPKRLLLDICARDYNICYIK